MTLITGSSPARRERRKCSLIAQHLPVKEGSVATPDVGQAKAGQGRWLCGYAEQGSNEVALSAHVIRWYTDNLLLPDHRHCLITRKRLRGGREALEAQPWPD